MAGATDIYDIILRQESEVNFITKGSFLTLKEGDDNEIKIGNFLIEMLGAVDVAAYVGATTYTLGDTVTHGGKYWDYIDGVDRSGITPGTNDTVWILLTVGGLLHKSGLDSQLTDGSGNVITAAALIAFAGLTFIDVLDGTAGNGAVGYVDLVTPADGTVVDYVQFVVAIATPLTPDTGTPKFSLVLHDGTPSNDKVISDVIPADEMNNAHVWKSIGKYFEKATGFDLKIKIVDGDISGTLKTIIHYIP